ncbi:acetyl-CoA carboxylase biotin carboxyl carrier protein [Paenibacillus sp. CMAA1364]
MYKLNEIKELIKMLDESSVQELEIEVEGSRLSIRKPAPIEVMSVQSSLPQSYSMAPLQIQTTNQVSEPGVTGSDQQPIADTQSTLHKIVSPMVGTFYRAASPDGAPLVGCGDKVHAKSTVCIIEAMKLMNELEAEVKGEIVEVLVDNGQLVEFGQPLFLVKAE